MIKRKVTFFNRRKQALRGFFYIPKKPGKVPAVIYVHALCSRLLEIFVMRGKLDRSVRTNFQKKCAFLRFYFTGFWPSDGRFEDITLKKGLADLKAAVDFVAKHPKVDPNRIALMGYSLGSLMSSVYAVKDPRIKALVLFSPPPKPSKILRRYFIERKGDPYLYLRYKIPFLSSRIKKTSFNQIKGIRIKECLREIKIPTLVVHAERDWFIDKGDTRELYDALKCKKSFRILKGANHEYMNERDVRRAARLAEQWFSRHLL